MPSLYRVKILCQFNVSINHRESLKKMRCDKTLCADGMGNNRLLLKVWVYTVCTDLFVPKLKSHVTRKPVHGVSDQVRLKPACTATETS